MKIIGEASTPGYIPEKSEAQSRVPKTSKMNVEQNVQVFRSADELDLSNRKVSVMRSIRESNIGDSSVVSFDVTQVPMMKQNLSVLNSYIMNNPIEALSAQANLNAENVARLIG